MTTTPDRSHIKTERYGIGASDARRIMSGDWLKLYEEKLGLTTPEDLSRVFRVQLGVFTENFHLDWLEQREGWQIEQRNHRYNMTGTADFMFAHIDGWINDLDQPIEVKHSNGRANAREAAVYYMAQLQHIMAVTQTNEMRFSVIAGNDDPELCKVSRNTGYISEMIELERSFWWHVENNVPPEITPTGTQSKLAKLATTTFIDGLKPYDMTGSNEWASLVTDYKNNFDAARTFEEAKTTLKSLVPADASECAGHGLTIKRDKRGGLRFS
jgi:predicted phage-related endonuclease